jgi:hypothetical protein
LFTVYVVTLADGPDTSWCDVDSTLNLFLSVCPKYAVAISFPIYNCFFNIVIDAPFQSIFVDIIFILFTNYIWAIWHIQSSLLIFVEITLKFNSLVGRPIILFHSWSIAYSLWHHTGRWSRHVVTWCRFNVKSIFVSVFQNMQRPSDCILNCWFNIVKDKIHHLELFKYFCR